MVFSSASLLTWVTLCSGVTTTFTAEVPARHISSTCWAYSSFMEPPVWRPWRYERRDYAAASESTTTQTMSPTQETEMIWRRRATASPSWAVAGAWMLAAAYPPWAFWDTPAADMPGPSSGIASTLRAALGSFALGVPASVAMTILAMVASRGSGWKWTPGLEIGSRYARGSSGAFGLHIRAGAVPSSISCRSSSIESSTSGWTGTGACRYTAVGPIANTLRHW